MLKYLKTNYLAIILILMLIILGTLFIIVSGENFIKIFSYLAASYLIIVGIAMIVLTIRQQNYLNESTYSKKVMGNIIYALVLFVLGILIIIFPDYLVRIFIGITLIFFPTLELLQSKNKKNYLRNNFWKYLIGIIFIIAVDVVLEILFNFIGVAFYVFALFLIVMLIRNYHNQEYPNLISKYIIYFVKRKNKE